jgi:hypothetical protein
MLSLLAGPSDRPMPQREPGRSRPLVIARATSQARLDTPPTVTVPVLVPGGESARISSELTGFTVAGFQLWEASAAFTRPATMTGYRLRSDG